MNWKELKKGIYYWDGSWRDIYIFGTNRTDWKKFIDFANRRGRISWYNADTKKEENQIEFERIKEFWNNEIDWNCTAKIFIDNVQINTHFFEETEIECDIDPKEFKGLEDHKKLMIFLTELSHELNKKIFVTPENCPEIKLIEIDKEQISVNLDSDSFSWPVRVKE